jgi:hypothetical protein
VVNAFTAVDASADTRGVATKRTVLGMNISRHENITVKLDHKIYRYNLFTVIFMITPYVYRPLLCLMSESH